MAAASEATPQVQFMIIMLYYYNHNALLLLVWSICVVSFVAPKAVVLLDDGRCFGGQTAGLKFTTHMLYYYLWGPFVQ